VDSSGVRLISPWRRDVKPLATFVTEVRIYGVDVIPFWWNRSARSLVGALEVSERVGQATEGLAWGLRHEHLTFTLP
jgi:hypothetical protein